MLNFTIFSKNRACQLELLLRSIETFVDAWRTMTISILYTASDERFAAGYERTEAAHPDFRYVREVDEGFKRQTMATLDPDLRLSGFLVDDDVFKAPFAAESPECDYLRNRAEVTFVSLRLGPEIKRSYTLAQVTGRPSFWPLRVRTWSWRRARGDWGYPMSLDGHLFRTTELLGRLETLSFASPNTLEGELARQPLNGTKGVCFDRARLVNVPANRVQEEIANRSADVAPAVINDRFLDGERIALEPFVGLRNDAPHYELDFVWEPTHL
jgi:hypothetical protein